MNKRIQYSPPAAEIILLAPCEELAVIEKGVEKWFNCFEPNASGGNLGLINAGGALEWVSALGLLTVLVIASTPAPRRIFYAVWEKHDALMRAVSCVLCMAGFVLCLAYLVNSSFNPFLYFRF